MRYHVLACDYDGTLARHGHVDEQTIAALKRVLASGRKLLLVTGRELDELLEILPEINLFEWVVAENGGLLYRPSSREERLQAEAPPAPFVEAIRRRGVDAYSVGRVIVATWRPHETAVLDAIRDLGLELQVIFNKDAVMVLPAGVNKASGLQAVLKEMGLSPHEVVGVGDAENDHAFLNLCEFAVAVDNALPALKERADLVMRGHHGAGVQELIELLLADDLLRYERSLVRHALTMGTDEAGSEVRLSPYGPALLIAGPSGSGKSSAAMSLLERLTERGYQFCIIDPEGDYEGIAGAITLGSGQQGPSHDELLQVLTKPEQNVVVNMVGLGLADRPIFFRELLPRLQELRARTGRPHWLVADEAHHLLPATWAAGVLAFPKKLNRTLFITVHPEQILTDALTHVETVLSVGAKPEDTIARFCQAVGEQAPPMCGVELQPNEVLFWQRGQRPPLRIHITPTRAERQRHTRKYAEGELPPERSFYFTGPQGKLRLRAQNLLLFLQIADGVDDETWLHHLRRGDYSHWFREHIKDGKLATAAADIERCDQVSASESRDLVRKLILRDYTLPAASPLPLPDPGDTIG